MFVQKSGVLKSEPIYTLGVASRLSGIPVHSIRQYVDKGLILPFKTERNRHLFSEVDVQRLTQVKRYIENGLNVIGLKSLYAQIPGYLIKSCTDENCDVCSMIKNQSDPCWININKRKGCTDEDCRSCEVYAMVDPIEDLNNYFLSIKKN